MAQLKADYQKASLNPKQRAMLDYAAKLTLNPSSISKEDILTLREAGFSDRGTLEINAVAGLFAFMNRLADGLGLEPFTDADLVLRGERPSSGAR